MTRKETAGCDYFCAKSIRKQMGKTTSSCEVGFEKRWPSWNPETLRSVYGGMIRCVKQRFFEWFEGLWSKIVLTMMEFELVVLGGDARRLGAEGVGFEDEDDASEGCYTLSYVDLSTC